MAALRIGLIGAGRIVPAHLRGYAALRAAGVDDFIHRKSPLLETLRQYQDRLGLPE